MEPLLTTHVREAGSATLDFYMKSGGYQALKKALAMTPDAVIEAVKQSGLRGRGGAGFPTGMKWQFVDKKSPKPKYLCCNADESEPGTFKDHVLMERNPHLLFEGCLIGCHAIGAKVAYIYIRGEFFHVQEVLEAELAKARAAGLVGTNILGTGFDCEIHVHRGAGAYEAGEETALIESLEGKRAQPRLKPPFPAVAGLYGCPTAVNNVETLCNVPLVIEHGAEWFAKIGPEKNGGPKLFCVSGHVNTPGTFETSMDVSLRDLIYDPKFAGGIRGGHALKAVIPGGSSVPVLPAEIIMNTDMDYDSLSKAGSMLGAGSVIVMDDSTCMVNALARIAHFYYEESCGQCTPCREGTGWLSRVIHRIEHGEGREQDLDLLVDMANKIEGRTICALGDAAAMPVVSFIKHFRAEFEYHLEHGHCMVGTH